MLKKNTILEYNHFLDNLKKQVAAARQAAAVSVNNELIRLYHYIGTQILVCPGTKRMGSKDN